MDDVLLCKPKVELLHHNTSRQSNICIYLNQIHHNIPNCYLIYLKQDSIEENSIDVLRKVYE